jgi:hypothetical protein
VFDPAALGPPCAVVKLTVYSEREPERGDSRVVDPKVLQQNRARLHAAVISISSWCPASPRARRIT